MLRTILPFVSADSNKQIIDKKYAVSFLFFWKEHFFSPIPVRSYTTVKTFSCIIGTFSYLHKSCQITDNQRYTVLGHRDQLRWTSTNGSSTHTLYIINAASSSASVSCCCIAYKNILNSAAVVFKLLQLL